MANVVQSGEVSAAAVVQLQRAADFKEDA